MSRSHCLKLSEVCLNAAGWTLAPTNKAMMWHGLPMGLFGVWPFIFSTCPVSSGLSFAVSCERGHRPLSEIGILSTAALATARNQTHFDPRERGSFVLLPRRPLKSTAPSVVESGVSVSDGGVGRLHHRSWLWMFRQVRNAPGIPDERRVACMYAIPLACVVVSSPLRIVVPPAPARFAGGSFR